MASSEGGSSPSTECTASRYWVMSGAPDCACSAPCRARLLHERNPARSTGFRRNLAPLATGLSGTGQTHVQRRTRGAGDTVDRRMGHRLLATDLLDDPYPLF